MHSQGHSSEFETVDPAPLAPESDVPSLERRLFDTKRTMFERYRALFSLRHIGASGSDAVKTDAIRVIARAMVEPDSALIRHEAAYVLGQMQGNGAIPALEKQLLHDPSPMVRHEAAEALGNMWDALDKVIPILERAKVYDPAQEVRESCEVALDNLAYLRDPTQFD
jgi:deoxyhypusine monooxygenase